MQLDGVEGHARDPPKLYDSRYGRDFPYWPIGLRVKKDFHANFQHLLGWAFGKEMLKSMD